MNATLVISSRRQLWGAPNYSSRVPLCLRVISYKLPYELLTVDLASHLVWVSSVQNDAIYASILMYLAE